MTLEQAGQVVGWLNAAFPRDALEAESAAIWITEVAELPHYDAALDAAKRIGRNGDRFPSLKEFRQAYRQAFDRQISGRELDAPDDGVPPPASFVERYADAMSGGICKTIDDLPPVTTVVHARPVYARAMQRQGRKMWDAADLPLPTEAEIHDAILVLAETRDHDSFVGDVMHVEATRILETCGEA